MTSAWRTGRRTWSTKDCCLTCRLTSPSAGPSANSWTSQTQWYWRSSAPREAGRRRCCATPHGRCVSGGAAKNAHLPILLYLRDHVAAIVADPNVALTALLRSTLGELRPAEPDGWFEQRLRDGECVVLLDGLDEVARPEDRRKVASWAERQIRQYPANDYVITSRPQGYRAAKIDGADVLQVRGFTTEQVSRFVHGWYLAVERHSTGAADEDITIRARREADDLLQRLDSAPALYDLTVNPLLLTMIANVHRYRGALPGSRADLYAEIVQVMLFRRQEAKNLPVELAGDKKEALLRGLAYAMMDRRLSDLPHDEVLAEIRPALRRLPRQVTAEGFLADVGSNGLLVERESGLYCFAHHTFQEYLAAAYIRDKGLADVLANAVDDPWWRETTLLYAARADADPIVAACLNSGTITALALAFDCADQGSDVRRRPARPPRRPAGRSLQSRDQPGTPPPDHRCPAHPAPAPASPHQRRHPHMYSPYLGQPVPALPRRHAHARARQPTISRSRNRARYRHPSQRRGSLRALGKRRHRRRGRLPPAQPCRAGRPAAQRLIISAATHPSCSIWIEPGPAVPELWVPPGTRTRIRSTPRRWLLTSTST